MQKNQSEAFIKYLDNEKLFNTKIVTEVSPAEVFYDAEIEHQAYYERNKEASYCQYVIHPKIKKLNTFFKDKLKAKTI